MPIIVKEQRIEFALDLILALMFAGPIWTLMDLLGPLPNFWSRAASECRGAIRGASSRAVEEIGSERQVPANG
jgi:hypothetical protein